MLNKSNSFTKKLFIFLFIFFSMNNNFAINTNTDNQIAVFAMGCFWCAEVEFEGLEGINEVIVGYAGGTQSNPTYENHQGYKEAIKIFFDPNKISFSKLLEVFWKNIDPFDAKGQFCDKGFAYTSVVYYQDEQQRKQAEESKLVTAKLLKSKGFINESIQTEFIKYTTFYPAEEYHQDYKKKNPLKYKYYRWNCGRDARLAEIWGS